MFEIVTVVDSLSVTSMPVNEFVIYRSLHNYDIKQIVIVTDDKKPENLVIPNNIEVYLVKHNIIKIKNIVKDIEKKAKELNIKIVYHLHQPKSALLFFLATIFLKIRKKVLFTVHNTFSDKDLKYKIASSLCALFANYINTVSKSAYNGYSSIIKYFKGNHFIAIQNGVDTDRIDNVLNGINVIKEPNTMIYVARIVPVKNHTFLVRILKELKNFRLILIGKEDEQNEIRKLANKLGVIDRVEFCGLISREKVFEYLTKSQIYVSSSTVEGLPVSVLEAMYVGLLPILSDIFPHREIKEVCPEIELLPLEEELWVKKIKEIKDFEIKSKIIREKVKMCFSLESMHSKYNMLYSKMCD